MAFNISVGLETYCCSRRWWELIIKSEWVGNVQVPVYAVIRDEFISRSENFKVQQIEPEDNLLD